MKKDLIQETYQDVVERGTEIFKAMQTAAADGGDVADYVDTAAADAIKKYTALAGEQKSEPRAAMVPSVVETDSRGNMVSSDLFSLLLKKRIVLLQGQVDDSMAAVAIASLLYLDSDACPTSGDPITVQIDSPGGSVLAGAAIYDTMRSLKSAVNTIGVGMQASMGSVLLAAGDKRSMTRSAKLMIHSIGSRTEGKLAEQEIDLETSRRLFTEMKAVYIRHIGLTKDFWDLICAKDTWLTAEQALKMGFIDKIVDGNGTRPAPYERAAAEFLKAAQDARDEQIPTTTAGIKELLLHTTTDEGKAERLRAELIVALAQKAEYWTPELKAAKKKVAEAAEASNDNAVAAAAKVSRKKTPAVTL